VLNLVRLKFSVNWGNWSTGQLVNWSTGQLVNWSTGQLVNWSTGQKKIFQN